MFEAMSIANAIKNSHKKDDASIGYSNRGYLVQRDDEQQTPNPLNIQRTARGDENAVDEIQNENRPLMANQDPTSPTRYTNRNVAQDEDGDDDDDDLNSSFNRFDENTRQLIETKRANKLFAIKEKFEMAEMASLFFSKSKFEI